MVGGVIMNKKGYYGALWACLGLLVIGAGVSLHHVNQKTQPKENPQTTQEAPTEKVSIHHEKPLEESIAEREALSQDDGEAPKTETKEESAQKTEDKTKESDQTTAKEKKANDTEETKDAFSEETDYAQTGIFNTDPLFQPPLDGDIIMDYSNDHAIYDVTLDQYRTNEYVSIGAEKGEKVKSSEDGTVESIYTDDERGKSVVINHNNGWTTTYSQLEKDVLVSEGEKVKKGQEIGSVADPSKYSVLLGTHLDFAVTKDGAYVDPKSALAE